MCGVGGQETATLVTFDEPTVPEPLETLQVWPDGLLFTVTEYVAPPTSWVANVNGPLRATLRSLPPLFCNTTVPDNPDTLPPIEYVVAGVVAVAVCGVGAEVGGGVGRANPVAVRGARR